MRERERQTGRDSEKETQRERECVCVCGGGVCVCVCGGGGCVRACLSACLPACVCAYERDRQTDRDRDTKTERERMRISYKTVPDKNRHTSPTLGVTDYAKALPKSTTLRKITRDAPTGPALPPATKASSLLPYVPQTASTPSASREGHSRRDGVRLNLRLTARATLFRAFGRLCVLQSPDAVNILLTPGGDIPAWWRVVAIRPSPRCCHSIDAWWQYSCLVESGGNTPVSPLLPFY